MNEINLQKVTNISKSC